MSIFCAAFRRTHCAYMNVFRAGFQEFFIFENTITKFRFPCSKYYFFARTYLGFRKSEQDVFDVHANHLQDKTRQNERAPQLFESNQPFILGGQHITYSYRRHHDNLPRPNRLHDWRFRRTQFRHAEALTSHLLLDWPRVRLHRRLHLASAPRHRRPRHRAHALPRDLGDLRFAARQ